MLESESLWVLGSVSHIANESQESGSQEKWQRAGRYQELVLCAKQATVHHGKFSGQMRRAFSRKTKTGSGWGGDGFLWRCDVGEELGGREEKAT